MMKTKMILALAAASLMTVPALADTYTFDLTGDASGGSAQTVDSGGFRFNFYTFVLSGFSPTNFVVGDQVAATITFNGLLTVPTASVRNDIDLILLNTMYPGTTTGTSGATDTFTGGIQGLSGASGSTTTSQLVNGLVNFGGSSFSFDSVQSNFTVTALGAASLDTDTALFRYFTVDALAPSVPEPASWSLLILGFAGIGVALRRHRAPRAQLA